MKRMIVSCALGLFLSLLICPLLPAQTHTQWFDPHKHLPISKVKPGMKGYGLSIFYGTKIERFEVEVRDVIKNFEPKRDAILVYLSGQDLERTGVIQGMSGSPVYLKDPEDGQYKIAGAVAFGWAFSRPGPAICGIQPIEEMLAVPPVTDKKPMLVKRDKTFFPRALKVMAARSADSLSSLNGFDRFVWAGLSDDIGETALPKPKNAMGTMGLVPLSTPLGVSGITADTFTRLSTVLSPLNLSPIKTGSPSAGMDAGDSSMIAAGVLAVPLASGDLSLAAIGTVTDVVGDHVWGFGHSFFAQGPMELPLSAGKIHAIIPSLQSSFKLGSPTKPIGTLYSDENTAVAGKVGAVPTLSPLNVTVNFNGSVESYHYDMAMHERLTPLLTMVCVMNSVVNHKELPELHLVRYSGKVEFENFEPIEFSNVSSDANLGMLLSDIAEPVNLMMNNEFERVKFKQISVNVEIEPKSILVDLKQVRLNKQEYRPGETAKVEMLLSQIRGPEFTQTIEFTVPDDLPDGEYSLALGGVRTAMQSDRRSHPYLYNPTEIGDLYRMIKHALSYRSDRFYLSIDTHEAGLGIRHYGLKNLPGTKLAQLKDADPALTAPFVTQRLIQIPTDHVVTGSEKLKLVISRNR